MQPTVLVTGGARRIGAAIVRAFAGAGWQVIVHYASSGDEAERLAGELPNAQTIRCDLRDLAACEAMVEGIARDHPDWRVLINCASLFRLDRAERLDPEIFAEAMTVNAAAPAVLAQAFLRHSRSRAGRRVIQVTDQKLANPNPDFFSYTMSKHALDATVAMLSMGLAGPQDRVYGLAPGAILASHDQTEREADVSHRLNPLGRRTQASEIAEAALFLAQGWLASGETLYVDSGQHLVPQPRDVLFLARE